MPKSDERFARQYRDELPPEFPLASFCSGIVHHLSGPIVHARPRTSPQAGGRGVKNASKEELSPQRRLRQPSPSLRQRVCTPNDSHVRKTPRSVFQDGRMTTIWPEDRECERPPRESHKKCTLYNPSIPSLARPKCGYKQDSPKEFLLTFRKTT